MFRIRRRYNHQNVVECTRVDVFACFVRHYRVPILLRKNDSPLTLCTAKYSFNIQ